MKLHEAIHVAKLLAEYKESLYALLEEGKPLPPLVKEVAPPK